MSKLRTKVLLQECIQEILLEDMGGDYGGLGFDVAGSTPYGMHFADQNQLYKIFVKPFADVVGVAAGKTKELSQKSQTLLKVTFETIATTLVPFFKDSYAEIFEHEKEELEKIKAQYADVYGATWEAFNENDIAIAAFMYRPDLFLTSAFVKKAPKVAAKLLSVLSGGSLDRVLAKLLKGGSGGKKADSFEGPGVSFESVIREDGSDDVDDTTKALMKLVNNEKVKSIVSQAAPTQQASKVGHALVDGTLSKVMKQVQAIMTSKTLGELQQKLGKKVPGLDKLAGVPQEERRAAETAIMQGVKKGMKDFYVSQLEGQVKSATSAGVPGEHPFVKAYVDVISKIKSL